MTIGSSISAERTARNRIVGKTSCPSLGCRAGPPAPWRIQSNRGRGYTSPCTSLRPPPVKVTAAGPASRLPDPTPASGQAGLRQLTAAVYRSGGMRPATLCKKLVKACWREVCGWREALPARADPRTTVPPLPRPGHERRIPAQPSRRDAPDRHHDPVLNHRRRGVSTPPKPQPSHRRTPKHVAAHPPGAKPGRAVFRRRQRETRSRAVPCSGVGSERREAGPGGVTASAARETRRRAVRCSGVGSERREAGPCRVPAPAARDAKPGRAVFRRRQRERREAGPCRVPASAARDAKPGRAVFWHRQRERRPGDRGRGQGCGDGLGRLYSTAVEAGRPVAHRTSR